MKKYMCLILSVFLISGMLMGCLNNETPINEATNGTTSQTSNETNNQETKEFEATVIEGNSGLLVTPVFDSSEFSSSDKISVSLQESEQQDGNTTESTKYKTGDFVRITYDGNIAESYPAQIRASKIELIGRNLLMEGYLAIIDDIYQEDNELNNGITMIAFNTTRWINLSFAEKEILLALIKEKYDLEIIESTDDELKEMGLVDEDSLYFKEGILIELTEMHYIEESNELSATVGKWRSKNGDIGWAAKARYKEGSWEITRDTMWSS